MQITARFLPPTFVSNGIPKINWNHPITNGLRGVWMPSLAPCNLVSGASIHQGTNYHVFAGIYGSAVLGVNVAGNTGFVTTDGPFIGNSGGVNWSIFGFYQRPSGAVSNGCPCYGERGSSGNDIIKLDIAASASSNAQITLRNDAGTLLQVASVNFDTNWHAWLATKKGNGGSGNVILYRDGIVDSTGNWTGVDSYTDATLQGGVLNDQVDNSNVTITLSMSAAWLRVLSPDEAALLANDPFCMLIFPEEYVAATLVGSAGAPAFTAKFRRTLSSIGTRVGERQAIG